MNTAASKEPRSQPGPSKVVGFPRRFGTGHGIAPVTAVRELARPNQPLEGTGPRRRRPLEVIVCTDNLTHCPRAACFKSGRTET
jgi:hypothetical protein